MSAEIKTFKLIVQSSDACVELLRYVNKNIEKINSLHARVQIVKIADGELTGPNIDMLRAKGITRMPVLLTPADKPIIGVRSIKELFEKNLRQLDLDNRVSIDTPTDIENYWQKELRGSKPSGRKGASLMDEDEDMNENVDYSARCAAYMKRVPHYGTGRAQDDEPAERPRTPRTKRPGRFSPRDDRIEDNIADDQDDDEDAFEEEPARRPMMGGGGGGGRRPPVVDHRTAAAVAKLDPGADEMDKQMMAAWMDNNGGGRGGGGDY